MGCENSKAVRVQPVGPASVSRDNTKLVEGKEGATQTPELKHKSLVRKGSSMKNGAVLGEEYDLDEHGNKVLKKTKSKASLGLHKKRVRSPNSKALMGSCESLEDTRSLDSDRGFSATSKQSTDSGLGEEYAHVITEFSEEDKIRQVESAFKSRDDLELTVTGVTVGTKNSAKDRARMEEAQVMQKLREEGLISKPEVQASGGMCFEIVTAAGDGLPRPPPRLEKLAMERSRKKKKAQTEDEILEKLERAERRRKKKEQERLEKIREMERTDALAALENFAQYQKSKEETLAQRMDQAQDNKERKQRELREKQERRRRHAEEVRKRKALAKETGTEGSENPDEEMTSNTAAEDTPSSSRKSPLLVAESSR